jgi:vacuolar-type H+-ATPase subunit I/STV1
MKKNSVFDMLYQLASPIAVTVLGLLLVVNPDSASILIARILGWGLTVVGIGFGVAALIDPDRRTRKAVTAVLFACAGGVLSAKPLLLAAWIGRFIGLLIALRGGRDLLISGRYGYSRILALGLSAGVVAQVVNLIATMGGPTVPGFLLLVAVMLIGHALNMAINLLGAFVHASRLQYLEFFGKFYEEGGTPFDPALPSEEYSTAESDAP